MSDPGLILSLTLAWTGCGLDRVARTIARAAIGPAFQVTAVDTGGRGGLAPGGSSLTFIGGKPLASRPVWDYHNTEKSAKTA